LVTAPGTILAASTGLAILRVLQIDNPVEFKVNQARLRRLLGTSAGGKEGIGIESIRATEDRWKPALDAYKQASAKYKLY
jgi:hypothetical protein